MNCVKVRELVGAYLDGELDGRLREDVESHLDGCSDCSQDAANLRTSLGWLQKTFPEQSPPAKLWEKVRTQTGE